MLDYPVAHVRDSERPELVRPARLGYPDTPHRLRAVATRSQFSLDVVEERLDARGLDVGDGDGINSWRTPVGAHLQPRAPEYVPAVDPVVQRVEASVRRPLGRPVELVLQGSNAVEGVVGPRGHAPIPPCPISADEAGVLGSDGLCCPVVHRYV